MTDIITIYLFAGAAVFIWCLAWTYNKDNGIPIGNYFLIILIWPYQVYLQIKTKGK
jgi:hypothetical protein